MKIVIEIKSNEQSCGKCPFVYSFTGSGKKCAIFNKALKPLGQGYKRAESCKEAEVSSVEYEGVKLWQHNI